MAVSATFIKNPLTIIGVFASLVELMGLGILPLIDKEIQLIYVWFLMFFPTALVAGFFIVLYRKHFVLYAPSDYQSDDTFAVMGGGIFPATADQIRAKQVEERRESGEASEVAESREQATNVAEISYPTGPTPAQSATQASESMAEFASDYFDGLFEEPVERPATSSVPKNLIAVLAEKWALDQLGQEMNTALVREVAFDVGKNKPIMFDAANVSSDGCTVVEVRTIGRSFERDVLHAVFERTRSLFLSLHETQQKNFKFVLAIVLINGKDVALENHLADAVRNMEIPYPFRTRLRIFNWPDLEERNKHLFLTNSVSVAAQAVIRAAKAEGQPSSKK